MEISINKIVPIVWLMSFYRKKFSNPFVITVKVNQRSKSILTGSYCCKQLFSSLPTYAHSLYHYSTYCKYILIKAIDVWIRYCIQILNLSMEKCSLLIPDIDFICMKCMFLPPTHIHNNNDNSSLVILSILCY